MIRPATTADAKQLAELYNYYIKNTLITFEEIEVSEQDYAERIEKIIQEYPFIVFEEKGDILGFAYAHKWRERSAYRFALESSVLCKTRFFCEANWNATLQGIIFSAQKTRM